MRAIPGLLLFLVLILGGCGAPEPFPEPPPPSVEPRPSVDPGAARFFLELIRLILEALTRR